MTASPDDSARQFDLHARNWTELAKQSPFWAVLSQPGAEDADWDAEAFFQYGREFGDWLSGFLDQVGLQPAALQRALDFGCGLGRLTQMLPDWFEEVHGVDVSLPMIEGARRFNRHGDRCRYHHNEQQDLALFEDASFDLVLSVLVLQHMRPEFMKAYLREFLRVLRPGGIAFFQVPICPIIPDGTVTPEVLRPVGPPLAEAKTGPENAVRVRVRPGSLTLQTGIIRDVQALVHNGSDEPLPPGVRLRARFLQEDSSAEVEDTHSDEELTATVVPGETVVVVLPVFAPQQVGKYKLEVAAFCGDALVQPQAEPQTVPVLVHRFECADGSADPKTAWRAKPAPPQETVIGVMQAFHLPHAEIVETLEACGGRIVHADEDDWSGPHHVSCHYTVTKG